MEGGGKGAIFVGSSFEHRPTVMSGTAMWKYGGRVTPGTGCG